MRVNQRFLDIAESLKPSLFHTEVWAEDIRDIKKNDILIDFGDHYVGCVSIRFENKGRHNDAPVLLEVSFLESLKELNEKPERYHGWICSSWIQSERIHLDEFPSGHEFKRRYSFRYIRIKVISAPKGFEILVSEARCDGVSSADERSLRKFEGAERDRRMDAVGVRTLHECMQEVFEDGPKRDRRLWLGDLRIQALVNYQTYRNYDLVKRCLYLFASDVFEDGRVANNFYIHPKPEADEQWMFDYSLLFIVTLWEYYDATKDLDTLKDLEETALRQYELSKSAFDDHDLIDLRKLGPCFIDWNRWLDKQVSAQGVYIYAAKHLIRIEETLGKDVTKIRADVDSKIEAVRNRSFDQKKGLYVSGPLKQISYASQCWMIVSETVNEEEAQAILKNLNHIKRAIRPVTPYMYHVYIEALLMAGMKEEAYLKMNEYWGAMLNEGADTFYEIFDPSHPNASPYGGKIIHSYCHAWSCGPSYFLRKYYTEGKTDDHYD